MRKDPIWYDAKEKSEYSLQGLRTCKEELLKFEEVSTIQIVRHYTQDDGKNVYSVVVWFTDGTSRNISTSVGAALKREYTWTIDKLRASWEPLELGRNLAQRMAVPRGAQDRYECDWESLQPREDTMMELWSRVRILDAYNDF